MRYADTLQMQTWTSQLLMHLKCIILIHFFSSMIKRPRVYGLGPCAANWITPVHPQVLTGACRDTQIVFKNISNCCLIRGMQSINLIFWSSCRYYWPAEAHDISKCLRFEINWFSEVTAIRLKQPVTNEYDQQTVSYPSATQCRWFAKTYNRCI